jgi:hypothetical protein
MGERKLAGAAVRSFKSKYDNYNPEIGEELLREAERIGNPLEYIKGKHNIDTNTISCWLGNLGEGRYKQEHFCEHYHAFIAKRRDWLDKQAITGNIPRDLWACLCWSNLNSKVNPPKEVTCEADVKAAVKIEDMNEIIQKLEAKKKTTTGF